MVNGSSKSRHLLIGSILKYDNDDDERRKAGWLVGWLGAEMILIFYEILPLALE